MRKPSDVDFPFLWNIFKRRYQYVLAFGIFCAALTFVYFKYIVKPVYRVDFSLFAWDYAGNSEDTAIPNAAHSNEQLQMANTIDRELIVADKMLNDYEKLMDSRSVKDRVKKQLELEYPELTLAEIPYRKEITLSRKTHFIDCSFFSESKEMALAAATVTNEVFLDTIKTKLGISKLRTIDDPKAQDRPVGRRPAFKAGVVFLFSSGFLFALFTLYAMLRDHITSTEQITKELQIPLLGTMVRLKRRKAYRNDKKFNVALNDKTTYNFNSFYEDFQILLTNLQYSRPKKDSAHIIMVTSSTPNEGKTLLSSYLSLLLAEKDKKVLMIHADIRKGDSADYFGLAHSVGLVDYIVGKKKIGRAHV